MKSLEEKILNKKAHVGIIGLGYVGLPLAVEFAKAGFRVYGIDTDIERVNSLLDGKSYVLDVSDEELERVKDSLSISAEYNNTVTILDVIIICVPTPLRKSKEPDISYIIQAVNNIKTYIDKSKPRLIVLESTTYPGTTEEVILPMLSGSNLLLGKDFYISFSPERIDPGNKVYKTSNIPKVVGGMTPECSQLTSLLYKQVVEEVVVVSSPKVAEMVKLLENTYRVVNIGLINEIAVMCKKLGINVWEVIWGAKTKPFGFEAFYPGPGLGGHCIPIDPFYLSWKARLEGYESKFIALADEVNSSMKEHVVSLIADALNDMGKPLSKAKILILGITYKKDVADTRESPAIEVMKLLIRKKAEVLYNDPYINKINIEGRDFLSVELKREMLSSFDCVAILTDHSDYDINYIVDNSRAVVDTRGATLSLSAKSRTKSLIYTL